MKIEERVLAIEAAMAGAFSRANDGLTGKQLREGEFREILKHHILLAQHEAERAAREEIAAIIEPCGDSIEDAITGAIAAEINALPSLYKEDNDEE